MPARSTASATISFGLVSIPVRLYTATEGGAPISFNLLHGKCGTRLKQQYVCPKDEEIVPRSDMVKGYEFAKDQYVTFTDDEIKTFAEAPTKRIEISEFLPIEKVDPVYYEGSTYLGPDKGGEKAYRLLSEAMERSGRVALAKWAARGKQYLVLLRPVSGRLVMQQLHYADEVRPMDEVPVGDATVTEPELKLALQLIDQIAAEEFRPETYEDDVRKRTQTAIDQKVAGQEITIPEETPRAQIVDIMEALKASLAGKGQKEAASTLARRAPKQSERPVAARPARAARAGRKS
jgi:DNA end-binding protein Ku